MNGHDEIELVAQPASFDPVILNMAVALQNTLRDKSSGQTMGSKLYVDTMANALATHLVHCYSSCRSKPKRSIGQLSQRQLKQVTVYIHDHLSEDVSLAELAAVVQLSPFHFARLFKQSTGIAPHQYHIRCRIQTAKQLIRARNLPLAAIAQAVGFSSQSHLNYHFKRVVGLTPTAFLKQ